MNQGKIEKHCSPECNVKKDNETRKKEILFISPMYYNNKFSFCKNYKKKM